MPRKGCRIPEYRVKSKNEDFEVTEVSLLPVFSKTGPYTYLWLKKKGFSSFEVQDILKDFFKLESKDINVQGLKDEEGVTSQILSVRKVLSSTHIRLFNKKRVGKHRYVLIERILGYGENPVAERMLHGNLFNIIVRKLSPTIANKIYEKMIRERFFSFVNYYDSQRFGVPGGPYNTHCIGEAIVDGDWKKALKEFQISGNTDEALSGMKNPSRKECKELFRKINPKKVRFFVSAYNSYLWNNAVSSKISFLSKSRKMPVEHIGDMHISLSYNAPIPVHFSVQGYEINDDLSVSRKVNSRLVVVTTAVFPSVVTQDEMHARKKKIALSFFLPTGSYATMCVRQLLCALDSK